MSLGELTVGHGMYGAQTLAVNGTIEAAVIAKHLEAISTELVDEDLAPRQPAKRCSARRQGDVSPEAAVILAPEGLWDGHLLVLADGRSFAEVQDGAQVPLEVPRTIGAELRHLIGLRDSARRLLDARSGNDRGHTADHRRCASTSAADYEQYLARYGALNRAELRRRGSDPDTGEDLYSRVIPKADEDHHRRPVRSAGALPRGVRRGNRPGAPRGDPPRASDHSAASRCGGSRHRRRRSRSAWTPTGPSTSTGSPPCSGSSRRAPVPSSESSSTTTPPPASWSRRRSTSPGTCASSSTRPATLCPPAGAGGQRHCAGGGASRAARR